MESWESSLGELSSRGSPSISSSMDAAALLAQLVVGTAGLAEVAALRLLLLMLSSSSSPWSSRSHLEVVTACWDTVSGSTVSHLEGTNFAGGGLRTTAGSKGCPSMSGSSTMPSGTPSKSGSATGIPTRGRPSRSTSVDRGTPSTSSMMSSLASGGGDASPSVDWSSLGTRLPGFDEGTRPKKMF